MKHDAQHTMHNANRESPIANQELKIELGARRVWKDGRLLCLTKLEYDVLEYLARRAGQIITYQELWREVW